MKVGLVQINNSFSGQNYLPYSVALLQAYVEKHAPNKHEFLPMVYKRAPIDSIVESLKSADLVGFSIYVWNERISLEIARRLKAIKPEIKIVMGGPQVPDQPMAWMEAHPWVNMVVHNEGERAFLAILEDSGLPWDGPDSVRFDRLTNIDEIPSPFLSGTFDALMAANPDEKWIGLWETNRGCPFRCTFCLAEGTIIRTMDGPKQIQDVLRNEQVLGWDEKRQVAVWNSVRKAARRGRRRVFKIICAEGHVEATGDHKFLTQRGWVDAWNLWAGDKILSNVRERLSAAQKDEPLLLQPVLDEVGSQSNLDNEGAQSGKVRLSAREGFRANAEEQSDEARGRSRQDVGNDENVNRERSSHSVRLHPGRNSQDQSGGAQTNARSRQPDEEPRDHEVGFGFRAEDAQRFREKDHRFSGAAQSAVPVHWGRIILGGAMPVGNEPEPGFRSYTEEVTLSDSGARALLAWQARDRAKGDRGLQEQGLADADYLGHGQAQSEAGCNDSLFHWATVISIEDGGEREVYDLVGAHPHPNFFANGFLAHNCDWGSATAAKITEFGLDRLYAEARWFSQNEIEYVFCCDANFGIKKRDVEIAKYVAIEKSLTGYPHALSVQNTKNATERAYETQKILSDAGLNKGVALSMQSVDAGTLLAVKRDNISLETYMELQRRFAHDGVETYSDLILGLPGETYDSFCDGVDRLISNGQHNRIQFNNLSILPNAEMGDPAYQQRYGMVTTRSEIINIHGERLQSEDDVSEYQQLVIATDAMPAADWRRARVFAWWCALLVFDKLFALPMHAAHAKGRSYREMIEAFMDKENGVLGLINGFFEDEALSIQQGGPEYFHSPEHLNIYWPADEYVFIQLVYWDDLQGFYREAQEIIQGVKTEAKRNQNLLNLPGEDFQKWCREVVWWGNKKGGYLRPLAGHT